MVTRWETKLVPLTEYFCIVSKSHLSMALHYWYNFNFKIVLQSVTGVSAALYWHRCKIVLLKLNASKGSSSS